MALITFLSDYGTSDHYVAAVKARIYSINPSLKIVDISHEIQPCDLAHAAYVLGSVFREFPEGTIHLVSIATENQVTVQHIALKLEGHYFIGPNNGLFGLISEQRSSEIVDLNSINKMESNFAGKDIYALAAAKLASGTSLSKLGNRVEDYKIMIPRKVRATKRQIAGNVVRVDHYGNLVTNIEKEVFNHLSSDRRFVISFGREQIRRLNQSYHSVENGECFVLFNSYGFLEIGINKGNASQLLGLNYDSPVFIDFED